MGDVVTLDEARSHRGADIEIGRRRGRSIVIAFPGPRHRRMVDNLAAHMATLDDVEAEEFLVFHFTVEDRRLTEQGIPDPEIEKYIFETARAIWARLRTIKAGVA